jgi:hypothetical protein
MPAQRNAVEPAWRFALALNWQVMHRHSEANDSVTEDRRPSSERETPSSFDGASHWYQSRHILADPC